MQGTHGPDPWEFWNISEQYKYNLHLALYRIASDGLKVF